MCAVRLIAPKLNKFQIRCFYSKWAKNIVQRIFTDNDLKTRSLIPQARNIKTFSSDAKIIYRQKMS